MASIITATTTSGLTQSADNSGVLQLASGTGNLVTVPSVTGTMLTNKSTGTVLQVVTVNDTTQYTFNSGSSNQTTYYNITGLVASITPSSNSNKILILANITAGQASNTYNGFFRTTRNGTVVGVGTAGSYGATATTGFRSSDGGEIGTASIMFLDSPATTSSVSYQIQICNAGGSSYPSYVNRPANSNTGWEQSGASSIILMEIAA